MEFDAIDANLVIKLAATAALVLFATLTAERFGAFIGAIIAAMPLSVGPSYLFLALEHGAEFVRQGALTSLAVHPMTAAFLVVCAALVKRFGIAAALVLALAAWVAGGVAAMRLDMSFEIIVLLNIGIFAITIAVSRPLVVEVAGRAHGRGGYDVLPRVLAVMGVVGAAILAGRMLGPKAAGLAALVPVIWISMAIVLAVRAGAEMCSSVLAHGVVPMIGFSLAFAALYLTIDPLGLWNALLLALALAVGWNLFLTAIRPFFKARAGELRRVG